MKAAVYHGGYYSVSIEELSMPVLNEGEALIHVEYAGICGTDLTIAAGKFERVKPPLVPGHEFSGRVEEIRSTSIPALSPGTPVVVEPLLSCGECYACRSGFPHVCKHLGLIGVDVDGAFASYVKVPFRKIYPIPEALSLDQAALIEPLAVAVHDVRRSRLRIGDTVVVLGAGPVGILIAQVARAAGASQVLVVEVSEYRLQLAKELGFTVINGATSDTVEAVNELTSGDGANVVFEVTGAASVSAQLVSLVRTRGVIVVVGLFKDAVPVNLKDVTFKELSIIGSRVYEAFDFARAIDLLAQGQVNVQRLITHTLPLEETLRGLEIARDARDAMKVLIRPQ